MKNKYSPENLIVGILELDAIEFLGICKIVGVDVYKDVECGQANEETDATREPRDFADIWANLCDVIESMNRTRRRNLGHLIYAATKKEKEK